MYQAILFDMDGTLLPMDQDAFVKLYFGALSKRFAPEGFEPKRFVEVVWQGTKAMITNDGTATNAQRFWDAFSSVYGKESLARIPEFDRFYANEFIAAKAATKCNPLAAQCIALLKEKRYPLVLATNPLFPMVAQQQRLLWAGLSHEDFIHITAYDNSTHCKPNPAYYQDICKKLGLDPAKCLMVGNDYREDGVAATLGMDLFLITDCLIAPEDADLSAFRHGSMEEFFAFLDQLPACE